ncbi:hypothetical protein BH10BAC2_BH10BAC2_26070 [soil metagenome]
MVGWTYVTPYKQIETDKDITDELIEDILSKPPERIQIGWSSVNELSNKSWKILNEKIFAKNNNIALRIFGSHFIDGKILKYLDNVKLLSLETDTKVNNPANITALSQLKELTFFGEEQIDFSFFKSLGDKLTDLYIGTHKKAFYKTDITQVSCLENLTGIFIDGYNKNLPDIFSNFKLLESVVLRYVSGINSPDFLVKLPLLRKLHIKSGGFKDLKILGQLYTVQLLELWNTRSIKSIDFISTMKRLQYLSLESVNGPTKFPEIDQIPQLRKIRMLSVKNLNDFSSLANTKSVVDFLCITVGNQLPSDFIPVMQNPHITNVGLSADKVSLHNELEALCKKYNKKGVESPEIFELYKLEDPVN